MKFMRVCVRFSEFVKDSEDSENSNYFVSVRIKFEMFEFVWEGKIWRMTPLILTNPCIWVNFFIQRKIQDIFAIYR